MAASALGGGRDDLLRDRLGRPAAHLLLVVGGMICFGIAWVVRPRIPPRPEAFLTRDQAPDVFHVVDRIGAALNAKPVTGIVVTADFNASYHQAGLPLRRYLTIGLPLFTILSHEEKIGILGHEFAHGINSDPLRSLYISTALDSLLNWAYLLRPHLILTPSDGSLIGFITSIGMIPVNILLRIMAKCLVWTAFGLLKLIYRDSQRAEYLADSIAAKVSGSKHFLSALEKLYVEGTITNIVRKFALNKRQDDIFEAFQEAVSAIPATEIERLRRVNLTELARIDTTHPPTKYRAEMIERFPVAQPLVECSDAEMAAFDTALKQHRTTIQTVMLQDYSDSLVIMKPKKIWAHPSG